jgi:hypothetical protein
MGKILYSFSLYKGSRLQAEGFIFQIHHYNPPQADSGDQFSKTDLATPE